MNNLHQAYIDLGIPVGSSLDAVERRYKRLVMAWHPDRYPNAEHKREAEEELKKINSAKDVLKEHLKSSQHRETGDCECRSGAAEQAKHRQPGSSGPGRKARPQQRRGRKSLRLSLRTRSALTGLKKRRGGRRSKTRRRLTKSLLRPRSVKKAKGIRSLCAGKSVLVQLPSLYFLCSSQGLLISLSSQF